MQRAFDPFWVVPALWCLGSFVAGLLIPEVDEQLAQQVPLLFQAGPDGARTFLSTIAGAMISVTGLVFSITIVVLQLASSQFSPRVLRTFLDQRVPQMTLGIFTASFVYALTVMRSVRGGPTAPEASVPQLAIAVSFVLVLGSVGMFLTFIHHITQSISVDTIVDGVGRDTLKLLGRLRQERQSVGELEPSPLPERGAPVVVPASTSGYLDRVDVAALVDLAQQHDVRLEVLHALGTHVVEGTPVLRVHGGAALPEVDWSGSVSEGVDVAWRRSLQQDVSFGMRQLVDIGERALSTGVNDPTTAVQVLHELHTILASVVEADDPSPVHHDADGVPRLVTKEWTFGRYLDLCVDEIAHWGASSLQVPRELEVILTQLAGVAEPRHRGRIEAKRAEVAATARAARAG